MSNVVIGNLQNPALKVNDSAAGEKLIPLPGKWRFSLVAVAADFAILIGIVWLVSRVIGVFMPVPEPSRLGAWWWAAFALLPLNTWFGLYSRLNLPLILILRRTGGAALCALAVGGLMMSVFPIKGIWEFAASVILFVPASILSRQAVCSYVRRYRANPFHANYVVTVGNGPFMEQLAQRVQSYEEHSNRVVANFNTQEGAIAANDSGMSPRTTSPHLLGYLTRNPADLVIFATSRQELIAAKALVDSILEIGLAVGIMPEAYDWRLFANRDDVEVSNGFAGIQMTILRTVSQPAGYLIAKRATDIALSALALLLLSPVFLLIAILIKLTSKGPVFYLWEVLGRNRKPFTGYKFRTMVDNADEIKNDLMRFNEMTGPVFKMRNDPRITPIGRWLRKYSLDEIPQFYSVLKGDMSLVGPRPPSQSESDRFELWQHRKLSVKPGITCLWQVNGRSEIADFAKWAELDIQYIATSSFLLDMKILIKTVPVVLFGRGAY